MNGHDDASYTSPQVKSRRTILLVFLVAPWCLLATLALINPRYERNLLDPDLPGLALLAATTFIYLLGAASLFAVLGLLGSLAERKDWPHSRVTALSLLIALFVTFVCLSPLIMVILLGPAAIVLLRAQMG